eukprot:4569705-Pleurochrysis_carterae.AAC.1
MSPPTPQGKRLVLPFKRSGGLYEWRVVTRNFHSPSTQSTKSRCLAIHASSRTHHHVSVMSPSEATTCMHARLHAGSTRL